MELIKICPPRADDGESMSRQTELLREKLGSALRLVDQMTDAPVVRSGEQPVTEQEVRSLLKLRRNRDRFFDTDLFADPAWDMLLELYAASISQIRTSVGGLCVAAAVPQTTALRWIGHLEDKGMILRRPDPTDGRRHYLMLSPAALASMNAYFRTVPEAQPVV